MQLEVLTQFLQNFILLYNCIVWFSFFLRAYIVSGGMENTVPIVAFAAVYGAFLYELPESYLPTGRDCIYAFLTCVAGI